MKHEVTPIGVIRTPYAKLESIPIQGRLAPDTRGRVEVDAAYEAGLADIEGFSHLILVYVFHKSDREDLIATPFLDDEKRGVFAIRTPHRPNHLGVTVVKLEKREGRILHVSGVDMLDGTPLLDIKPYVSPFDAPPDARLGWLASKREQMLDPYKRYT